MSRTLQYKCNYERMTEEEKAERRKILLIDCCEACGKKGNTMILFDKRICSEECFERLAFRKMWPDYIDLIIRRSPQYLDWRRKIIKESSPFCRECGSDEKGKLEVHHAKSLKSLIKKIKSCESFEDLYFSTLKYTPIWDVANGIILCRKCHLKKHTKRSNDEVV